MRSALQELEETVYWLEIIVDSKMLSTRRLSPVQREAEELIAIFVTCIRKLRSGRQR
jgi:four helix bundle protein